MSGGGGAGVPRVEVPELEWRAPDCPGCGEETESDGDGFECSGCGLSWDKDGRRGEWWDREEWGPSREPGCASEIEWFNTDRLEAKHEIIRHNRDRCTLAGGHAGRHKNIFEWRMEWDEKDPRVVVHVDEDTGIAVDTEWWSRGHTDAYCIGHCRPGIRHSQCDCRCGHKKVVGA